MGSPNGRGGPASGSGVNGGASGGNSVGGGGFGGGGTNTGWGGGGTTSGRGASDFSGGFTGSDWGSSSFGSSRGGSGSPDRAVSAWGGSPNQQAIAAASAKSAVTTGRFNEATRQGQSFGGPQSPVGGLTESGIAASPDRSNEMGMANTSYSPSMNRGQMTTAIAADMNRGINSTAAKWGNLGLSMVAPPLGTVATVGRGLMGAVNEAKAGNMVDSAYGIPAQSMVGRTASNLAAPVGGYIGGQFGGQMGAQIGFDMGGIPGAIGGGLLGAIGGQTVGSQIGAGIAGGKGVGGGVAGSLSNAAGINMVGSSKSTPPTLGARPTTSNGVTAQLPTAPRQPIDYGTHVNQFIGNPNRAATAWR